MAIQVRRGNYADLDKSKLVQGEPFVTLDQHDGDYYVGMAIGANNVVRLATQDSLDNIKEACEDYRDEAEESAEDSEAWAIGKRGGTPVSSDDPTYHNNSKYYAVYTSALKTEVVEIVDNFEEKIPKATTSRVSGGAIITVTDMDGSTTSRVYDGITPNISATGTVDANVGTPAINVTTSGTISQPVINFAFSNMKGNKGDQGYSPVVTITAITGGNRVTITDQTHPSGQSFDVMNGTGSGDMQASTYDSTSAVANAGGIPSYVSGQINALDGSITGSPATSKTLSAFSETNGVVSATFSDISITKSQISDFPTIPTVNNGTLTIQQNGTTLTGGTFTANQSGNSTVSVTTDSWVGSTATVSSGAFSFSGLDDTQGYGFKPYVQITGSSTNMNPTAQISSITGAGTSSMTISYTTDADEGATVKMRIVK